MEFVENLILGAGLSGLSTSFHLGHKKCLILEASPRPFGHISSEYLNGFVWDTGPHVSFTKHDYVKKMFAKSVHEKYLEKEVKVGNYYYGDWIDHPVQANLYQVPEPLRTDCVNSFLQQENQINTHNINNYKDWSYASLGQTISEQFVRLYTRKYWTTELEDLSVDWVGNRIYRPSSEDIVNGSRYKRKESAHYIKKIRYPKIGGYQTFANIFINDSNIRTNHNVIKIDPKHRIVHCDNNKSFKYHKLFSSIPLPNFVNLFDDISFDAKEASKELSCTQLLLVNVEVPHVTQRKETWIYVYDEDKFSTRINFTEKLSHANTPNGMGGIQVEVYFSKYRPLKTDANRVAMKILDELYVMGLIESEEYKNKAKYHVKWAPYANIIFDHERRAALSIILDELQKFGLVRRNDDLEAMTEWDQSISFYDGNIVLLGRFGEWKYHWSDDCVLCGRILQNKYA